MKRIAMILTFVLAIMLSQCALVSAAASVAGLHSFTAEESVFSKILVYHQATTAQSAWQSKLLGYGNCTGCEQYYDHTYMGFANVNGGNNKCSNCGASLGWGCGIYAMAHAVQ